jgi:soluble lytic murein transglycosylase
LRTAALVAAAVALSLPSFWQAQNPLPYRSVLAAAARRNRVSVYLLAAVVRVESRGDPRARSAEGAMGLMQVTPATARWAARRMGLRPFRVADLYTPSVNVAVGAWYLAYLLRMYDHDMTLALAAYNAGPGAVNSWLADAQWNGSVADVDRIPFGETRQFVRLVAAGYRAYRRLYDPALWTP